MPHVRASKLYGITEAWGISSCRSRASLVWKVLSIYKQRTPGQRDHFSSAVLSVLRNVQSRRTMKAHFSLCFAPGGAHLRKEIYESKVAPEVLARVEDFFEARLFDKC